MWRHVEIYVYKQFLHKFDALRPFVFVDTDQTTSDDHSMTKNRSFQFVHLLFLATVLHKNLCQSINSSCIITYGQMSSNAGPQLTEINPLKPVWSSVTV